MLSYLSKKAVKSQTETLSQYSQTVEQQLMDLQKEVEGLQSKYSDMPDVNNIVSFYSPLIDALQLLYSTLIIVNSELTNTYFAEIKGRTLKADFLEHALKNKRNKTARFEQNRVLPLFKKWRYNRLKKQINNIETTLADLKKINRAQPDFFKEIELIQKLIKDGLKKINKHQDGPLPNHSNAWLKQLESLKTSQIWFQWYRTKVGFPTDHLTVDQSKEYDETVDTIFYHLYYNDGWDLPAIESYIRYLMYQSHDQTLDFKEVWANFFSSQRKKIGSPSYLILFKNSHYSPKNKINLVLQQLGATIDENQMLQLLGTFEIDTELSPHSYFIELFCQTVQEAYRNKKLNSRKIHQLRMYFDRQNIQYIRSKFPAETDEQSLQQYVAANAPMGLNGSQLIRERGRFHNKIPVGMTYSSFVPKSPNRKRLTPNFHSEFILDKNGHFVSQWNVLTTHGKTVISDPSHYKWTQFFEGQLLNTESLNYGRKNDLEHKRLDSYPPGPYDHNLRKKAKKKLVKSNNNTIFI